MICAPHDLVCFLVRRRNGEPRPYRPRTDARGKRSRGRITGHDAERTGVRGEEAPLTISLDDCVQTGLKSRKVQR